MIKTVGIGDSVIDRYYHQELMFPGGNALNFSVYSSQLFCQSAFVGVIADDNFSRLIIKALDVRKIDRSMCRFVQGASWLCSTRLENGERTISDDNDGGVVKRHPLKLDECLLDYIRGFDIVHTNVNGHLGNEIRKLKQVNVPVIYDYSDFWESESDLLSICPFIDFAFFSGKKLPRDELKRLLKVLVNNGCELAICTIGKDGAIVYDGLRYYIEKPYNAEGEVVDTLGAGDSFLTGFIVNYIEGRKRFNNIVAGNKNKYCTQDDVNSYRKALIKSSIHTGNLLAIKNCMVLGAFGDGATLVK